METEEPESVPGNGGVGGGGSAVASLQERRRKAARESRGRERHLALALRRFSSSDEDLNRVSEMRMPEIIAALAKVKFNDHRLLERLKILLAGGSSGGGQDGNDTTRGAGEDPEDFFTPSSAGGGDQNLYALVNLISGCGTSTKTQLPAVQVVANLSPLSEKSGLKLARAAGPYLVTLLSSGSHDIRSASAVALGNLALAGYKVVKVLVNQDVVERLTQSVEEQDHSSSYIQGDGTSSSSPLYALYHLLHVLEARCGQVVGESVLDELTLKCLSQLEVRRKESPLELFWVLFALSCIPKQHHLVAERADAVTQALMEVCTYEIYQKSDPRPLVKVVTPVIRFLANLCAGPDSETLTLSLVRHPDTVPILMALLGTNYHHLCKETLWLFANIVNSESIAVQEEIVELDLMDKLEYHTTMAVQKLDPYAVQF